MPATSSQRNESRNSPERLQRTFLLYSVFAVLIACLVVSAAAVFPVVNQYAAHEEDEILHALQLRTLAIREFLTGAREIANQIGSRTKARQALDAYERGETDLDTLRAFTRPILADAIERSAQVAGITRLDARGAIVVSLGVAVPGELHYRALPASDSPEFRGPTTINGRPYTLVANPIFETAGRRLGADLLLIDATALKRIVEDPIGLRRTGASALGALRGGKMEIFCAYDSTTSSLSAAVLATESGLGAGLEGNPDSNSGTSSTEDANGRSVVVTYSRIPDTDWIAIVSIDKSELYEGLSQQLRLMGFVVIPLVVIGLLVMLRILKPLIARMNAHAAVLRGEIEERKRAEAEALLRADQQAVVAELGQHAFRGLPKSEMMDRVVAALASTLNVEFVKVLELMADGQSLLLRAGVGWREGLVGRARVATARDSQAGYTLLSDGPVVVEDHASEKRFSGPLLLQEHGIRSGASVLIRGRKGPFGVLGVHSRGLRRFTSHDLNFIQTVANLLGETVERTEAESALAENEMRLRAVFASALDPIIITNADGIVQAASDSVERCFGWHPRETLGKSIDRLFYEGFHREYQQDP
ncbi:MAG: GAF domain-containing protein, partial [Deltaproteobacteria bacterium]|nr:GAF domain-containing protein [Deltaproteobacteria bacterium]